MRHFAIDIETMGKAPDSAILSIGAVEFNDGGVVAGFSTVINLQSCMQAGLKIYADTTVWWMQQSEQARSAILDCGSDDAPSLGTALVELSKFMLGDYQGWGGEPLNDIAVWGNGSDFDNATLQVAFDRVGLKTPWCFWNNRDLRTLRDAVSMVTGEDAPRHKPEVAHDAYHDAVAQAKTAADCMRILRRPM